MKTKYRTRAIEFNKPNKNGRVYTKENFEKNNNLIIIKEQINNGLCFIESGSTDIPELDMMKIAGIVTDIELNDDGLDIEFEIAKTPCGEVVQALIDSGKIPDVAVSGQGDLTINANGEHQVVDYIFNKFFFTLKKA